MLQFVRKMNGPSFVLVDLERADAVASALRNAGLSITTMDAEIGLDGQQVTWIDVPSNELQRAMTALREFTRS